MRRVPSDDYVLFRGWIYLLFSKSILILSSVFINIFLARWLGPQEYGRYGTSMAFLVWIESAANPGISVALQKKIAQYKESTKAVIKKVLFIQLGYSGLLILISLSIAHLVAYLLRDPRLTRLLIIASVDVVFSGIFTVYYSALNGILRFGQHAICGILYSIAKVVFITILVMNGFSIIGALIGNVLASVIGAIAGYGFLSGHTLGGTGIKPSFYKELVHFAMPVTIFAVIMNLLLNVDIFMVKRILWQNPEDVGCYVLASTLAKSFYNLTQSLSGVLFPTLAQAISAGNRRIIQSAIKYMEMILLILTIGATLVVVFFSSYLINLFFSDEYIDVIPPLPLLIVGMGAISYFYLLSTISQAINALRIPIIIASCCAIVAFLINQILISRYALMGAAWTVILIGGFGAILMKVYINTKVTRTICIWKS